MSSLFRAFAARTTADDKSPESKPASRTIKKQQREILRSLPFNNKVDFDNAKKIVTYGGLRDTASRGVAGLQQVLGLKPHDVVCIYAYNSVNWALLAHSVWWAGASISTINPLSTAYELVHYLEVAQPDVIAVEESMLKNVQQALKEHKLRKSPKLLLISDKTGRPSGEAISMVSLHLSGRLVCSY